MIGTSIIKELNTIEKSDTDLPNLGIMSPYLHGYDNHLSQYKMPQLMKKDSDLMF